MNKIKITLFLSALYLILSAEEGMATKSACDACMGSCHFFLPWYNVCPYCLDTCVNTSGCSQQQVDDSKQSCLKKPSSKNSQSKTKPQNKKMPKSEKKPGSAKPKSAQLPRKNEKTLKK